MGWSLAARSRPGRKTLLSQFRAREHDGTRIVFDIAEEDGKTKLTFTHVGLNPKFECYDGCSGAWSFYVNDSLRPLIAKGEGRPNKKEG